MVTPELDPPRTRQSSPPPRTLGAWRALVLRLHFFAGVLVGPFILVAALTGGLYAAAPTLERAVYGDVLTVTPGGAPLSLTAQVDAARAAYPDLTVAALRPSPSPEASTRVLFADPALGPDEQRAVFVDPYTGAVLGQQPVWFGYLPLSTWLDGLHRHLHLGEPGRVYSEMAASWLWVVALGGTWLWLMRARRNRTPKPAGRSRTMRRHALVGLWLLPMLLFLSATGITWSTYAGQHVSDIRAQLDWQRPQLDSAVPGHHGDGPAAPAPGGPVDYDRVVAAAERSGVGAPLEVVLPEEPGSAVTVTEIDAPFRLTTDVAAVDPATGTVTSSIDYWRDYPVVAMLADWGIRMHMGFLFGWPNQLLLFVAAGGAAVLIGLGYRMWWQRRPPRGSVWAVGRSPAGGGLRRLPVKAAVAVVGLAVAVGWFLPVLGWTLAAFVVADLTAAALDSRRREGG